MAAKAVALAAVMLIATKAWVATAGAAVGSVETAPVAIGTPHVCTNYPPSALKAHAEGVTDVLFKIATDGTTREVTVRQSSGNPSLDEAAVECASAFRYKPATREGIAVEVDWESRISWVHALPVAPLFEHRCEAKPMHMDVAMNAAVTFRIATDGTVRNVSLLQSSGDPDFDAGIEKCVTAWAYTFRDGQKREMEWAATFEWSPQTGLHGREGK